MKKVSKRKLNPLIIILIIIIIFFYSIKIIVSDNIKVEHNSYDLILNDYNFNNLSSYENIKKYNDEKYESLFGIDISYHQGDIDWEELVKNNLDFIYLRAAYRGSTNGDIYLDSKFIDNVKACNKYEIPVGYYFFDQAISIKEAVKEANYILKYEKKYPSTYPIVLDLETVDNGRCENLDTQQRTEIALAFLQTIEKSGKEVMIYASGSYLLDFYNFDELARYPIWLAHYADIPNFDYEFKLWQYSKTGNLSGITEKVDLDIMFIEK